MASNEHQVLTYLKYAHPKYRLCTHINHLNQEARRASEYLLGPHSVRCGCNSMGRLHRALPGKRHQQRHLGGLHRLVRRQMLYPTELRARRLILKDFAPSRPTICNVSFFRGFCRHLQLHLRIFFEDPRVALAKQLHDPLVGDAARV